MIKICIFYLIRLLLSFFKIFPIKSNTFFFCSYQGMQYSCNPRTVYEYLNSNYSDLTFIWVIDSKEKLMGELNNNRIICVKPNSIKYYKYLISSKYIITNIQLPTYVPKNKESIIINTWHGGGAFKKVEFPVTNLYTHLAKNLQIKNTDFYISSSRKFTEVMGESTGLPKSKFLEIGMPRNDVFFADAKIKDAIRRKVLNYYRISYNDFVVLFAPTYRGGVGSEVKEIDFDFNCIKNAFEKKFNKHVVILLRTHHANKRNIQNLEGLLDGTLYPDMQDLLVACDSLITDYSSCIWDFSLTYKPGFLFVPDIEEYNKNRGLYMPINEWCFDYAKSTEELKMLIENYDEKSSVIKIKDYLLNMGCFDTGDATKKLVTLLMSVR